MKMLYNYSGSYPLEANLFETDGEDDENKKIDVNGVKYPHKSWFLVFHSTITGVLEISS